MNRFNNIFNKNEVENKLRGFKEGEDYSVAREGKKLIYNFHNNWLRDEFGNYTTVYEVAENWDSDNFNHHREEGKYINNDKGTEITYRYEHRINKGSGDHYGEWSWGEEFEDNSKATWTLRGRPNPKKLENFDSKPMGCCECGKSFHPSEVYWYERSQGNRFALCSSRCKERFIEQKEGKLNKLVGCCNCGFKDIGSSDNYCQKCGAEPRDKEKSNLVQENQELRKELSEVKNQLAQVLDELKKLKRDINGKGSEKLERQIVQNEKLIKEDEKVSVAEVQEQVNKSQALMNEFNTAVSSNKGNGSLPYVIGGSVILVSAGIIGYWLMKKNKRK